MEWKNFLETNFKVGDKLWICDYRFNNLFIEKPIRHVIPTHVVIESNEDLPKNKRVHYSDYHFKCLNKNGSPLKGKIIAPFDNTGFRSYTGVALKVFLTEDEARAHYSRRCAEIKIEVMKEKNRIIAKYDSKIKELEEGE